MLWVFSAEEELTRERDGDASRLYYRCKFWIFASVRVSSESNAYHQGFLRSLNHEITRISSQMTALDDKIVIPIKSLHLLFVYLS